MRPQTREPWPVGPRRRRSAPFGYTALRQREVARPASEGAEVGVDEEEAERCLDVVTDGGGWRIDVMRFHERQTVHS